MSPLHRRTIPAALAIAALGLAGAAPGAVASRGADDSPSHRANDDRGERHSHRQGKHSHRGDDRRHGHRRHGGHDDGPNHH
jgi:hypothetical protein